ncbi:hypothetical protein METHB2_380008 [Candidatus Methylobacter favarea]|uniref:Uncharacterized protein n=1 Tax=Candidatus Methylobacter favarea TaxID=2707345 RepID=A0A8S0WQ54_9GAMM|nr:hypothetical protein METHB2_380008 [Candidatus Methylobacter favarea]
MPVGALAKSEAPLLSRARMGRGADIFTIKGLIANGSFLIAWDIAYQSQP